MANGADGTPALIERCGGFSPVLPSLETRQYGDPGHEHSQDAAAQKVLVIPNWVEEYT
jgi:hypothetical protein